MIYYINHTVKFNTEKKTLMSKEQEHSLTNASVRLLKALIDNNGIIMSRDDLILVVWESQGYVSSGNSLTNTISLLRKALVPSGLVNLIETVPKQGFRLNAEVITTIDDANQNAASLDIFSDPNASPDNSVSSLYEIDSKIISNKYANVGRLLNHCLNFLHARYLLIFTALALVFLVMFVFILHPRLDINNVAQKNSIFIKRTKNCDIYSSPNTSKNNAINFMSKPYAIDKLNEYCESPGFVFYDESALRVNVSPVESLMTYCSFNNEGSENDCENFIKIETR